MQQLVARYPRVIERLLSVRERTEARAALGATTTTARLATKRFAAKEALVKALGGAKGLAFSDASVVHDSQGKPAFELSKKLQQRLPPLARVHLSISDERSHAIAMVVIESTQDSEIQA